jgi:hypothetical protein
MNLRFNLFWMMLILSLQAFAQSPSPTQSKQPRVLEVEEFIRDEASRYFGQRFPGSPFMIRVEVSPLRRDTIEGTKTESLPYFDYESEDAIDEWDDMNIPIAFLRHRVTKVSIEVSVSDKFDDAKLASVKEELILYLKLIPFRDEVKVERKLSSESAPLIPNWAIAVSVGIFLSSLIAGLLVRSGMRKTPAVAPAQVSAGPASSRSSSSTSPTKRSGGGAFGETSVKGDVTFHDPLKTMDIVHLKIDQIEKSGTFPTLTDLICLNDLGLKYPNKLGAVLSELPTGQQRELFKFANGQQWLEAFSDSGRFDHDCLMMFDRLAKKREYTNQDRHWEDLLIQIWRMGDKAVSFMKKIPSEHAFVILSYLPKSFSLSLGKKSFPGGWGRLLAQGKNSIIISPQLLKDYLSQCLEIEPYYDWKLLDSFKNDKELLVYLDTLTIDEEKDIYETLPKDSFVLRVRPAFFRVFDQSPEKFKEFIGGYPLDKLAIVVINSPRNYIKMIQDALEEKQRYIFSQNLKDFDGNVDITEQQLWKKQMTKDYADRAAQNEVNVDGQAEKEEKNEVKTA